MKSFCTYFDAKYLCRGIALLESLERYHPDEHEVFVLCLDAETERALERWIAAGSRSHVWLTALSFLEKEYAPTAADLQRIKPQRTLTEFYWSITSLFIEFTLPMVRGDSLVYLDADTFVFHSLDEVYAEIEDAHAEIAITPHRFNDKRQKTHGVNGTYNVGFVYFRKDSEVADACLREWSELCIEWCYQRSELVTTIVNGKSFQYPRFGDQGVWNMLVPKYGAHAIENLGCNLAPWSADNYEYWGTSPVVEWLNFGDPTAKNLYVIDRDKGADPADSQPRIEPVCLWHAHGLEIIRTADGIRFKRGGYPLPLPVVRYICEPYEAKLLEIMRTLEHE